MHLPHLPFNTVYPYSIISFSAATEKRLKRNHFLLSIEDEEKAKEKTKRNMKSDVLKTYINAFLCIMNCNKG